MRTAINKRFKKWQDQQGITIVLVAGLTVMFVAFVALSVDIAHLYAVQNELQAAADAGALAGGRRLYYHDGSAINTDSNQIAYEAAIANNSDRIAVEVQSPNTNSADVQRGHWSFTTRTFTQSDRTTVPDLWDVSTEELDGDTTFVNAIRVRTRRQSTQANSFFARILGFAGFNVAAEAVAYIGYAGQITPLTVDQPIALCKQSMINDSGEYTCSTGRMMNANVDSAAWTNFSQPCITASAESVTPLVCGEGGSNETPVTVGYVMGTNNGQVQSAYDGFRDCWIADSSIDTDGDGMPDQPYSITLPVIDCCPDDDPNCDPSVGNCMKFIGIVNVDVLWVVDSGASHVHPPRKMGGWSCAPTATESQCWTSFTDYYNLQNYDGSEPELTQKAIYFKPSCAPHFPVGNTGGQNFGVLAQIPVLVK